MTSIPDSETTINSLLDHLQKADAPTTIREYGPLFDQAMLGVARTSAFRVTAWLQAGEILIAKGQYGEAEEYLKLALQLGRELGLNVQQARALGGIAEIFRARGDYRTSLNHLIEAETLANESGDFQIRARIYIAGGLNHVSLGLYDQARDNFYDAYMLYAQSQDLKGKAIAANRLGMAEMMLNNFREAESHLEESLQMSRKFDDRHAMAGALVNLGEVQRKLGRLNRAREYFYEAGALFSALGVVRGTAIVEINLGHLAVLANDFNLAKYHYIHALGNAQNASLIPEILDTLSGLALILMEQGLADDALKLASLILSHPACLEETEEFLAPIIAGGRISKIKDVSFRSVDDLIEVANATFKMIFQES